MFVTVNLTELVTSETLASFHMIEQLASGKSNSHFRVLLHCMDLLHYNTHVANVPRIIKFCCLLLLMSLECPLNVPQNIGETFFFLVSQYFRDIPREFRPIFLKYNV